MTDIVDRLRLYVSPTWGSAREDAHDAADEIERLRAEIERLRCALHDIAEEWAGAECGDPVYAQEAYAIGLAKRMYALAVEVLR